MFPSNGIYMAPGTPFTAIIAFRGRDLTALSSHVMHLVDPKPDPKLALKIR